MERKSKRFLCGDRKQLGRSHYMLQYGVIKPQKMFSMAVPLEELEQALEELKTNKDLIKDICLP